MPRKKESDELEERDLAYRIAQAVHDRRTELGWSQRQLAEAAGMRQPHVSRQEPAEPRRPAQGRGGDGHRPHGLPRAA
ncbi:helix-turn-helix domain-containing protein [Streptomyces sp. NPDC059835]|uniref:helix-turn-helix domain-containing protein n=1 Tax=Streptomyces sp. NPDC059835 TaxID=3346967 RepID=UPI00364C10A8